MAREAGPSLALLFRSASAARSPLGGRDCYRPLSGQVAVSASWTARAGQQCLCRGAQRLPDGGVTGTSMHGWGKAVDLSETTPVTFSTPGYRFLRATAGRLGWNHPGWAEPGGSACPEPWHWEWVGDGGTDGADPVRADVVALLPAADEAGVAVVTGLGAVEPRGDVRLFGGSDAIALNWVIVGAAGTPSRAGYWLLVGDARFFGSTGASRADQPIVGMAATPNGNGYWLVTAAGTVVAFGNAPTFGSLDQPLDLPVVALARTIRADGYWIVAADGTVVGRGAAGGSLAAHLA